MLRCCLSFAVVLVLFSVAAALPPSFIRSAVAFNATSRCTSRDVRLLEHARALLCFTRLVKHSLVTLDRTQSVQLLRMLVVRSTVNVSARPINPGVATALVLCLAHGDSVLPVSRRTLCRDVCCAVTYAVPSAQI
jgi:hypothetical protein